jgi:hypothetical protein
MGNNVSSTKRHHEQFGVKTKVIQWINRNIFYKT